MTSVCKHVLRKSCSIVYIPKVLTCRRIHVTPSRFKAKIIDGQKIAQDIRLELKKEISEWIALGNRRPQLTALLIGDDRASSAYVSAKMKAAKEVGISSKTIKCPASISELELLAHVDRLNRDPDVDGILVQVYSRNLDKSVFRVFHAVIFAYGETTLDTDMEEFLRTMNELPLPEHITERAICNAVVPHKDVDGFHIVNVGRFCLDMKTLVPCTPLGVQELIRRSGVPTFGRNAVVCGRSKNVGMPIAMLLHADGTGETSAMDATTTICHRYTPREQLAVLTKSADIIVSAAGVPNLIRADMVKEGVCVIDVGITRIKDEKTGKDKLVGDVDFEGVREVAGHITPVPGGVGPMTVAMLMKNTLLAAKKDVVYNILDPGAVVQKKASQLRP